MLFLLLLIFSLYDFCLLLLFDYVHILIGLYHYYSIMFIINIINYIYIIIKLFLLLL